MKKTVFLLLLSQTIVFAQKADIEPNSIKKHIEYLASDKLEGRGTGTEGGKNAAKYLVKQFKKIGLKPYGD